ncbi:MAG: PASTA domain-containing protein [candidate division WOR-3 bacterium]|nr:MAG: PASTA domain-containing protein [candidate division WOR-3 bacterium]
MAETAGKARTLADLLKERGFLPEHQLVQLFTQVLEDLELNHSQAQLHLDIKPEKIVRTVRGTYKLADYGMSRLGTAKYMSPERAERKKPDGRSDIYSLGVVMYQTATGRLPFGGELNYQLLDAHINQTPPMPRSIKPEISGELQRIILTALAKDPRARHQSAKVFREALEELRLTLVSKTVGQTPVTAEKKKKDKPTRAEKPIDIPAEEESVLPETRTLAGVMSGRRPAAEGEKPRTPGWVQPHRSDKGPPRPQPRPQRLDAKVRKVARARRVPRLVWIAPVGVVVLVGALLLLLPRGPKVPDLVGLPSGQAEERVKAAGLVFAVDGEKDDTLAKGMVAAQNLASGTRARKGTTVAVFISTGVVGVPELAGMTLPQAREQAVSSGFVVGTVDTIYSDRAQSGLVFQVSPAAGEKVAARTELALTVVAGRATCPECGRRRERGGRFCISCGYKYEF